VLRFLQRAASNLQHEFKVVVPSSKLPVGSRKNLLATQLRDFIQIYNAVSIYNFAVFCA
jgi:tubulin polyglutamylase TTLL5